MSPLLTTASTVMCPHQGIAMLATGNAQAMVGGAALLLMTDRHGVAGCTFAPGGVPSPCLTIEWHTGATQIALGGAAVLLQTSVGLCLNAAQAPQGPAIVAQAQSQALGV